MMNKQRGPFDRTGKQRAPLLLYVSMTGSVDYLHMLTTSKVNKDRRAK